MTEIFFSGGESPEYMKTLIDSGVKSLSFSFYYLLLFNSCPLLMSYLRTRPDLKVILDAGSYTFFAQKDKVSKWGNLTLERYVEEYKTFVRSAGKLCYAVTEPDFDHTFPEATDEKVAEWREELFSLRALGAGAPPVKASVMPVWHWWRGPKEWTSYCQDSRVEIAAIGRSPGGPGYQRRLAMEAHRNGKLVHALGIAKLDAGTETLHYDSVSSSTWLSGNKFGILYVFRDGVLDFIGRTDDDKIAGYGKHFDRLGIPWRQLKLWHPDDVTRANILAWSDVSRRLQAMKKLQR